MVYGEDYFGNHCTWHFAAIAYSEQICGDTSLVDMRRHLGLEVIVTLAETAPAMLRKHKSIISLAGGGQHDDDTYPVAHVQSGNELNCTEWRRVLFL